MNESCRLPGHLEKEAIFSFQKHTLGFVTAMKQNAPLTIITLVYKIRPRLLLVPAFQGISTRHCGFCKP